MYVAVELLELELLFGRSQKTNPKLTPATHYDYVVKMVLQLHRFFLKRGKS